MLNKQWINISSHSSAQKEELAKRLGIHPVLAQLLLNRGITNFEEAKTFFRPNLEFLHDPFLMKDMDKAVARLELALKKNEKILVFGDYDVDGTTAVSMMYLFLKNLTDNLSFYIPDRYKEGYGISNDSIDFAAENNFTLIISLDCGTKSVDKIASAKEKGIDYIVCDHHQPGEILPDAVALLNPKRKDCAYPCKHLSGAGVGFKLIQAYCEKNELEKEEYFRYLDLLAVSIGADIVPIVGENRVLAYYGLQKLNQNPSPGLQTIIAIAKRKGGELTMSDIGFGIGPRINAAGRLYSGSEIVELLVSSDKQMRDDIGSAIDSYNEERKSIEKSITEEALQLLIGEEEKCTSVVFNSSWHKGVVGIVASRLQEKYYRPTLVFTEADGKITGSARSVKGFNILEAIEQCGDLLEQYGGHDHAAGMTMKAEDYPAFKAKFEEVVSASIPRELLQAKIMVEDTLSINDIDEKFHRLLKQFEPFGPGNETPIFSSNDFINNGECSVLGQEHLKLELSSIQNTSKKFPAIAFRQAIFSKQISSGNRFSACYSINENHWKNKVSLQLEVKDVRF
jgi:single-stranded-DNA-specific exonuclease